MTVRSEPRADLSRALSRRLLALLTAVAGAVYVVPVWWGLPAGRVTWAFDEIVYQDVVWRWPALYPPLHRYVLQGLYALLEPLESWGLLGRAPRDIQASHMLVGRLFTVALACLTLGVLYRCARRLMDRRASLLAVASFAFGANVVYYAKTANLDVPYLFWFALSLFFFLRCLERRSWPDYVLFAALGSLAIATKTQAYGLYLLPPLVLVVDLWRARPRASRALLRAVFDRRILAAGLAAIAVQLAVFGELWGSGELGAHLAALRSLPYEHYATWSSPADLVLQTWEHLLFNLGLPVLAAAVAGLALALWRWRNELKLLSTLSFAVSYYASFIVVTGFNYDRHYLPIILLLALPAGKALGAVLAFRRVRRLAAAGVVLILAHALLRGVSVDLMLAGDARFEAERWLAAENRLSRTVGLGSPQLLPRRLATLPVKRFARWRRGEHLHNPQVWNNCVVLNELGVEFLIPDDPRQLGGPGINYREHRRFENRAPWSVVDFGTVSTARSNIAKIAADVVVFERTDEDCVDSGLLPRALHELRLAPDPERRRRVARGILGSPGVRSVRLKGSDMYAVRVYPGNWTAGALPAGVAYVNGGAVALVPVLRLEIDSEAAGFPVVASVDTGERTERFVFERPGAHRVELGAVEPGEVLLAIVWADRAWRGEEGYPRGVRLAAELPRPSAAAVERLAGVSADLAELRSSGDEAAREAFMAAVERNEVYGAVELEGGARLLGGRGDAWAVAGRPAGVVVENNLRWPTRVRVVLSCSESPERESAILAVADGDARATYDLACDGPQSIPIGRLLPGERRLFILELEDPGTVATSAELRPGALIHAVRQIEKAPVAAAGGESAGEGD